MDVQCEELEVRYASAAPALEDVTVRFEHGSQTLILGPAGSGKTTLLKVIAGLIRPSGGKVRWDADDACALSRETKSSRQAQIGMIFQTDALFDSETALENVILPLRKRHVRELPARERALQALSEVGLIDFADAHPEQLSGGMRKRLGVARAIVAKPGLLLADDPLAGIDSVTAEEIGALLLRVSAGRTLIVCAPQPLAALPIERGVRMERGRLIDDGAHQSAATR